MNDKTFQEGYERWAKYGTPVRESYLRKRTQEMLADGTMPSLEEVLKAVAEVRAQFAPQILAARQSADDVVINEIPAEEPDENGRTVCEIIVSDGLAVRIAKEADAKKKK